jgi:hypothetical protein
MLFAHEGEAAALDPDSVDRAGGEIADSLATLLSMPCIRNPYRHELIDVTRSLGHRRLFGPTTRSWPIEKKQQLIDVAHAPYQRRVERGIRRILQQFTFVVHLSVRTLDLRNADTVLRTDVGLAYDPSREDELEFCLDWIDELYREFPHLRVRRNYPKRGTVDSLAKSMRRQFPPEQYLGVEVLLNRAWAGREVKLRDEAVEHLADALRVTIGIAKRDAA